MFLIGHNFHPFSDVSDDVTRSLDVCHRCALHVSKNSPQISPGTANQVVYKILNDMSMFLYVLTLKGDVRRVFRYTKC